MPNTISLSKTDTSLLLRIIGSRTGADFEALSSFQRNHIRNPPTDEQMRESLARLVEIGLVAKQADHYLGQPELQAAFFNEVRNCRDTLEEYSVLERVLATHFPQLVAHK